MNTSKWLARHNARLPKDYRQLFHSDMAAREILNIDFRDFFKKENALEKPSFNQFWQKDWSKARSRIAASINAFLHSKSNQQSIAHYESLRLRKLLYARLVAFRVMVLEEVENMIGDWSKHHLIDSRHRDRLLKLLTAEREMIPWGIRDARRSITPISMGEVIEMWERDKQTLAHIINDLRAPQFLFVYVIHHLCTGPSHPSPNTAALEIKRTMEPYGVFINESSLEAQYYRLYREGGFKTK